MDSGGIVFLRSERFDETVAFYRDVVGCEVWREQPDCTILDLEGFRVGFCDRSPAEIDGTLTFVVPDRASVDRFADRLGDAVVEEPRFNGTYDIYQVFARDPEGRTVEVQCFEE
jgi:catechol 2,3-dioxygenase-like lactoylglutathione lyase family enzyme